MKILLITLFLLTGLVSLADANNQKDDTDQYDKKVAITALFEESPLSKKIEQSFESTKSQYYSKSGDERVAALVKEYDQLLREELLKVMVKHYGENFTLEEIQVLLNWSRSPIAKKSLDLMPMLTQAVTPLIQKYSNELTTKLQNLSQQAKDASSLRSSGIRDLAKNKRQNTAMKIKRLNS